MSTSYGPGRYDTAYEADGRDYPYAYVRWTLNRNMQAYLEFVSSGDVRFEPLIDRIVAIDAAPAVYEELARSAGQLPLAVLLHYPEEPEAHDQPSRITIQAHRKPASGRLNYALVGAGAFATAMLVPQMRKRSDRFFLRGIVSRSGTAGSNFARDNQVETLTSDLDVVLEDPAFALVVIATRHHEHGEQVARSLAAGKHVFVEKPLAISWDDLERVTTAYGRLQDPPCLLVGFNRRFSPALQMLQQRLQGRRSPLVIEYRLNAGYIALDHWVHGAQGGGRNIGEACHMYDVFRFLSGAAAKSVSAAAIDPGPLPYARNDNFVATITYEDGTVANLVYTALGPKTGFGKEHITVFCDGEAYVVDDFRQLTRGSDGTVLWEASEPDKGHFEELSRFGDAIAAGAPPPIPFAELVETSALALHIEDLIHGRTEVA